MRNDVKETVLVLKASDLMEETQTLYVGMFK